MDKFAGLCGRRYSLFRYDGPADAERVVVSMGSGAEVVRETALELVHQVTGEIMAGRGNEIPVSAMPIDGTFPVGKTQYEKRNIAVQVPIWAPELCIHCGQCSVVCPHSVIRAKAYKVKHLEGAPAGFKSAPASTRGFPDVRFSLQF